MSQPHSPSHTSHVKAADAVPNTRRPIQKIAHKTSGSRTPAIKMALMIFPANETKTEISALPIAYVLEHVLGCRVSSQRQLVELALPDAMGSSTMLRDARRGMTEGNC
ncbi:hypothetical protein EVAR_52746_1 [Eumeta japonica]|uniref:Uncharacterized protein n=1 Tax=Eumeta variegata TaxID=151549 RepID=A0A4C1XCU4_EUMVA|nr:hypothetical protein EVAR_52746_1 [Eumeta japonica]